MKYNFDEIVNRRGTGCVKWDEMPSEDMIPLWVADMDFKAAPAIQEALRKRMEHGVFGYTIVEKPYYEAIISWFQRRHSWTIHHEEILYRCGTSNVGSHQGTDNAWRKGTNPFARLQLFFLQHPQ